MSKQQIVYKSKPVDKDISIAGSFNSWSPEIMEYNFPKQYYQYFLNTNNVQATHKIYFKFIENAKERWFTDDNFSVEYDENGNDNNVMVLVTANDAGTSANAGSPNNMKEDSNIDETHLQKPLPALELHTTPNPTPNYNTNVDETDGKEYQNDYEKGTENVKNLGSSNYSPGHDLQYQGNNSLKNKNPSQDVDYHSMWKKIVLFLKNIFLSWVNWFKG